MRYLAQLETWISRHPGQWLCTKRRWPRPPKARNAVGASGEAALKADGGETALRRDT
jgi:hypothetical protein